MRLSAQVCNPCAAEQVLGEQRREVREVTLLLPCELKIIQPPCFVKEIDCKGVTERVLRKSKTLKSLCAGVVKE
jgi:uncharacterized protein (DUF302 family)